MTVQKILYQQIANTGGIAGQVLIANSTGVTWGDANNAAYLGGTAAASYQTTAGLSANVATLTSNNTSYVGTVTAANVVSNAQLSSNLANYALLSGAAFTGNVSISGTVNAAVHSVGTSFIANSSQLTIATPVSSNGGVGTSGQVLTSNGATGAPYWSTVSGGGSVNVAAQYAFTNTISFSNVVTHTANVSVNGAIIANGGAGTSGQVLTSSAGGNVYWSTVSGGGGGFSNGQSISVANLAITGSLTANASVGTAGQALISTGTGVQWGVSSPGYNYSSQFNGAANFFAFSSNSAFTLGTGDFTIECWVYPISLAGGATNQPLIDFRNASNGVYPTLYISGSTVNYFTSSSNRITAGSTLSNNTWYHLAVVRISGSTKLYINGVQSGSTYTDSNSYVQGPVSIGNFNDGAGGFYINALISNARIVKGTGVYTGAFTVPTSPLSAISGTSLLTCNSITPSDSSSNNFAPVNNGVVLGTATQSPFTSTTVSIPTAALTAVRQAFTGDGTTTSFSVAGGYTPNSISVFLNGVMLRNGTEVTVTSGSTVVFATAPPSGALIDVIGTVPTTYSSITPVSYSVSFNGTSQSLSTPANTAFQFGSNNFTVEMWINFSSVASGQRIAGQDNNTSTFTWTFYTNAAGTLNYFLSSTGSTWNLASGTLAGSVTTGTWYHIALVRNGSTFTPYINGVAGTTTTSASALYVSASPLLIGAATGGSYFNGYISNFRIVNGVAVYTNNFTVPSSPLQAVQSASGYIQAITGTQTSLLTCNGPTIIDGSTNAFTITNNGSAPVSTAIVPTFTNVTINNAVATATTYSVQALLIAGGGAGGAGEPNPGGDGGGGGGAGGVIQNNINLSVGTVYSIVIGAGGSGGSTTGGTGTNSTFAGLTAYGGGGGGDGNGATPGSGGSGGGAGNEYNASTWSGGCVYNQGYPGGPSVSSSTLWRGGSGGGGAGGFGTSRTSNVGGNGGSSISLAITGSTVWYAGGGGGGGNGTYGGGTGGNGFGANQGGGGNGGTTVAVPGTGTTNTGGGGGGGVGQNVATSYTYGASGGSGVVILSILTSNYTGTKTGSPTVTTNGSYTILTFTASGSYTA